MQTAALMAAMAGGTVGLVLGLVGMIFWSGGTWDPSASSDPFAHCTLYKKILLGDDTEHRMAGKVPTTVTIHYYNATYICGQSMGSRVEKVES